MPMPPRILVVEDEQIVAKDVQRTLQRLGYDVTETADTGAAAMQLAEELRPDLVLMDIRLRGPIDGVAAASDIRDRRGIPVVYLTAHADPATLERAKITEPFGYVVKPFEDRDLHATIEMALYKHRMELKLLESERWLAVTLKSIGDGVIATDTEGRVVFINPVAEALTGWRAQEAIGRRLSEVFRIINERTRRPAEDPVARILETGLVVGLANHTLLIARDGVERPIDDSGAPIQMADGQLRGTVLVFRDVTERRQLEQALEQRAEQLANADRRKDDFLAMLGHELRNPLAAIVNGVEVLGSADLHPGDATRMQQIISRQARHMQNLIDDLLDVTRITRGRVALNKSPLDLVKLVRQAAEDQRPSIEAHGSRLRLELPTEAVCCEGDPTRLSQVLANLLTNATKFLGGPGEIAVTVRPRADSQSVTISVRDTGIGMDSETLRDIFRPFVQATQTLDRSEGGLGLGLALVRGLVELHGGQVTASSPGEGQGSEFVIELPTSDGPIASVPVSQRKGPDVLRRVLVVDDNEDATFAIRKMLEYFGHQVFTAEDGAAGIAVAREKAPEVIFCDIGLPGGMSGYDFAAAIRSDAALEDAYLVAVSGYGQDEHRQRARDAGFDNHLTKPVTGADLQSLLTTLARFADEELAQTMVRPACVHLPRDDRPT